MATFTVTHGLSFAPNSWVENIYLERLSTDPPIPQAGRVWFNSTDKYFKCASLDAGGSVIVRKFSTMKDLADFQSNLAATTVDTSGTTLVGYDGLVGTNGTFSVNPGQLDNVLDSVVQKIDDVQNELNTNNSSTTAIQNELDNTQVGGGLQTDGSYSADSNADYISGATSLFNADILLDAQAKTTADNLSQEISDRQAADALKVNKAGDSMSGSLDMGGNTISNVVDPVNPQDVSTKNYVDTVAQGLDPKESSRLSTTADLDATYDDAADTLTMNTSAALSLDGVAVAVGDRVLIKDQADGLENGIYIVDNAGDDSTQAVLSRAVDFNGDPAGEVTPGAFTFVEEGVSNDNNGYVIANNGSITIGTTDIHFEQFSGAGQVIPGTGIDKNGNTIYINMGAGIVELPSDEVGLDIYDTGGLFTTIDGSTESEATGAQLSLNLDNSDSVFGATLTTSANGVRVASAITSDIDSLHNELDTTQTGAGLAATGAYNANTSANYINSASSLKDADNKLDSQAKTNADGLAQEISDRQGAVAALQTELDGTQSGSGLATDGAYVANTSANYISGASSLFNADNLLDNALKNVSDNLNSEISNRQTADAGIQSELDSTQTGAGLSTTGDYQAANTSNYISGATSIHNATIILDNRVKVNEDDVAQEISDRQAAVSALKNSLNAKIFKQQYATATTHSVAHNLNTSNVEVTVWVKDTDGKWKNDIVGITIEDANNITVDLTESREISVIVRSAETVS